MFTYIVDSSVVLWGQTLMYTAYCLAILSLMAWFAVRVTKRAGHPSRLSPRIFYTWVGFLSVLGVASSLLTYNTIPWVKDDLHGSTDYVANYAINVADHEFQLPQTPSKCRAASSCGSR